MKFRKVLSYLIASMTLGSAILPATSVVQAQEEPIVIGANYELSGYSSSYGVALTEGTELAIEDLNEQGGILGRPVEMQSIDNKSDKTETASVASRMVNEGVAAIVGPGATDMVNAQKPIIDEAGITTIIPAATADDTTFREDGSVIENVYRLAFTYTYQANASARFAFDEMDARRAVVITDTSNDYSTGQAEPFKVEFERLGGEIVTEEFYQGGEQDFSAIVTNLMAQDFDIIYMPAFYTEGGLFIKQAREFGLDQPVFSGHGFATETLVELAGQENANDIYYTSQFYPGAEDEQSQAFVKAYQEKFNKTPDTFAAFGYDSVFVLAEAMERAGSTDYEAVSQALADTNYQGLTGLVEFDEDHNPANSAPMRKMVGGEIVDTFEVDGSKVE
ncbi:ABC transporter substrate-binding protein [Aerococcaceae bacterium DSM 111020]|nr:ABC transporter substrate-binding protein [Aerococcaceae bacterium DSM 111020]